MTDSEKIKSLEVQLLAAGKVLERIDRNHCDCIYKPGSGKTHNDWCVKYIAQQALTPDIQKLLKEDAYRRNQIEFWKGSSEGFEKISLRMSSENADLRKQLDEKDARIKELATQRDGLGEALKKVMNILGGPTMSYASSETQLMESRRMMERGVEDGIKALQLYYKKD